MAEAKVVEPGLLVVATFSGRDGALAWARDRLEEEFGPLALAGLPFAFDQTSYYQSSMGPGLRKQLLAFRDFIDPGRLADAKLRTNSLERELREAGAFPEERPINIDPGYLTQGKFVLATMKDHAHRIYLGQGVFAEVTLHYRAGQFEPWPWTYRDYQLAGVRDFLEAARVYYRERRRPVVEPRREKK